MAFHGMHYMIHQTHHLNILFFALSPAQKRVDITYQPSSSFLSSPPPLSPQTLPPSCPLTPPWLLLPLPSLSSFISYAFLSFFFADSFPMVREDFHCKKLLYITWTKKNVVLMFKFSFKVRLSFA